MDKLQLERQLLRRLLASAIAGLLWVSISVFWIEIRASWICILVDLFVYWCILLFWLISLLQSFIFAVRTLKTLKLKSLAPLSILILCCVLVFSIDPVVADFYLRFERHAQPAIVSLEARNWHFPSDRHQVAVNDIDIPVAKSIRMTYDDRAMTVFFKRYQAGVIDGHAVGYTYRSDDSESKIHDPPSGPVHRKIKAHWFWGIDPFDWSIEGPAF